MWLGITTPIKQVHKVKGEGMEAVVSLTLAILVGFVSSGLPGQAEPGGSDRASSGSAAVNCSSVPSWSKTPRVVWDELQMALFVASSSRLTYTTDYYAGLVTTVDRETGKLVNASFGVGYLSRPAGIAVAEASERVYIVNQGLGRVVVTDLSGRYKGAFGSTGQGDGQFMTPIDVAVNSNARRAGRGGGGDAGGEVYVLDVDLQRIQVFTPNGSYVRKFNTSQKSPPVSMAVDTSDNSGLLHVAHYDSKMEVLLPTTGAVVREVSLRCSKTDCVPTQVSVDDCGFVYVAALSNPFKAHIGAAAFERKIKGAGQYSAELNSTVDMYSTEYKFLKSVASMEILGGVSHSPGNGPLWVTNGADKFFMYKSVDMHE